MKVIKAWFGRWPVDHLYLSTVIRHYETPDFPTRIPNKRFNISFLSSCLRGVCEAIIGHVIRTRKRVQAVASFISLRHYRLIRGKAANMRDNTVWPQNLNCLFESFPSLVITALILPLPLPGNHHFVAPLPPLHDQPQSAPWVCACAHGGQFGDCQKIFVGSDRHQRSILTPGQSASIKPTSHSARSS